VIDLRSTLDLARLALDELVHHATKGAHVPDAASSATCPICDAPQVHGLTCHACTTRLEQEIGDVPAIVNELDVTLSRQARIGAGGKAGSPAHERWAYSPGASAALDDLTNTLTTWARDLDPTADGKGHPASVAARVLLSRINDVRAHDAAAELDDEIREAIRQARRAVDRPADRQFVGPCLHDEAGVVCEQDLYAQPGAEFVRCKVCGTDHDVADRRVWLLGQAGDMLFTVREAAQMVGSFGGRNVAESTIRGYVSKGLLGYHGKLRGSSAIKLAELLTVIVSEAAKPKGRRSGTSA
jgi:hypothetical protein